MSYNEELAAAELTDKVLIAISLDSLKEKLILHTNAGDYLFETYGDCCSQSWVEHFDQVKEASVILGFREIEIDPSYAEASAKPTVTDFDEYEMKYYFYEILTDKGSLMIEMRNSSNGYYGGDLCFQGVIK